jgi:hypothetical protein
MVGGEAVLNLEEVRAKEEGGRRKESTMWRVLVEGLAS